MRHGRALHAIDSRLARRAARQPARWRARSKLARTLRPDAKVHLGCGRQYLDGWTNVDCDASVRCDVRLDLRAGFPAPDGTLALVFSEHLFEHLTLEDGRRVFEDCRRALCPGGVMRIAMPDLRYIVEKYLEGRSVGDAEADGRATPLQLDSPARLLNVALRSWGHLYLYDFEELQLRLRQAGFSDVVRQAAGSSSVRDLCGLERRVASRLVVEARA